MAKAKLYDKPRYAFDEEHLFSHSHGKKEETKTFPWWKPTWSDDVGWVMINPDGKEFTYDLWPHPLVFPLFMERLVKAASYEMFSTFFVEWMKQISYYQGVSEWNACEVRFKAEFPNKKPDQIARMCDEEVAKFFLKMKG